MNIPIELIGDERDEERVRKVFGDLNHVTNIIWQSERESFRDCEYITEQIIVYLLRKGYLTKQV